MTAEKIRKNKITILSLSATGTRYKGNGAFERVQG